MGNIFRRTVLKLPELVLPLPYSWIVPIMGVTLIASVTLTSLVMILLLNYPGWLISVPVLCFVLALYIETLLAPKRKVIKQKTLREFTEKVMAINYKPGSIAVPITREELEMIINKIVAAKGGVDLSEITPEKKIHNDLGID